jgi:hypothetical protein
LMQEGVMNDGVRNQMRKYTNRLCVGLLAGTLLLYSDLPLFASPQSSQSGSDQSNSNQSGATANGSSSLPEAPQPQSGQTVQQQTQTPSGAAGAPGVSPKGSPAAQPAGAAVAPAKQHGHRSLLIKVGLIAGGAIAIGTVVALSERSPTRPPGTAAAIHQ